MRIYKIEIVISGNNDKPETRVERIISGGWQETHELLARICRDTGCVIRSMLITETNDHPFDLQNHLGVRCRLTTKLSDPAE